MLFLWWGVTRCEELVRLMKVLRDILLKLSSRGQNKTATVIFFLLTSPLLFLGLTLSYEEAALKICVFYFLLARSRSWHLYGPRWFVLFLCSTWVRLSFSPSVRQTLWLFALHPILLIPAYNFLPVSGCQGKILNYAPMGEVCNFTWLWDT